MKPISSIEDLFSVIYSDKHTKNVNANRYPVRFVFLPSFFDLKTLVTFLIESFNINKIELKDLLPHHDGWLTYQDISAAIDTTDENDILLLPLSELARFFSKDQFSSLFNVLSEIENSSATLSARRIYIPLVGLYERFYTDFFNRFSRKLQWAPIFNLTEGPESKIKIYITNLDVSYVRGKNVLSNTKQWFDLWKSDDVHNVICVSNTLMHLFRNSLPDQVFDLETISTRKDLISKAFGINLPIAYEEKEANYWEDLLKIYSERSYSGLKELINNYFNKVNRGGRVCLDRQKRIISDKLPVHIAASL
jgi:hypothetical protein